MASQRPVFCKKKKLLFTPGCPHDLVNKQELQKLWQPLISAPSRSLTSKRWWQKQAFLGYFTNRSNYAHPDPAASCLVFESMQTIVVILRTGGYQCRPIGPAQTRTFSTARKSLGLAAAIMLWLTGSPWVPNDPNKYILYPRVLHLPASAATDSILPVRAIACASVDRGCLWAITNN